MIEGDERVDWRWGVDVLLAVVLGGLAFADGLNSSDFPRPGWPTALLMGCAGGALVLRRIRPTAGFVVCLGLMTLCALVLGQYQSGSSILVALVAAFSALAFGVRWWVFAIGVLIFAAADAQPPLINFLTQFVFASAVFGLAGAAGHLYRRTRTRSAGEAARRQLAESEGALLTRAAVDDERDRVARELHDILSHSLGVVVLQTGAAEHAWDREPDRARESIRAARTTALEAIDQLRTLLTVVRDDPAADRAPVPSLADLSSLARRTTAAGFRVDLEMTGTPRDVSPQVQASVFRVTQEGVANAMKHSGATGCRIHLEYGADSVVVHVEDDGRGVDGAPGSGLGLAGIGERVAVFAGTVDAGPSAGGGWRLTAVFPA